MRTLVLSGSPVARDSWDRQSTGTFSSLAMIFSAAGDVRNDLLAVFAAVAAAAAR